MLVKKRTESYELRVLRSLILRKEVTQKEKLRYLNLEKGYEGELKFDRLLKTNHDGLIILNDLLFEIDHSYFQIDTLIISKGVIQLIDIKNFDGECYLSGDKLYSVKSRVEYNHPVYQLKRCETLLSKLLKQLKYNDLIKSSIIFINPTFTLYQAPMDQPIVLPTQVSGFIKDINNTPTKLSEKDKELAQNLLSLHQLKNPFSVIPEYSFNELKKGTYCSLCKSYLISIENHHLVCSKCKQREKTRKAILRHTQEFQLLFPEQKITVNQIYHWCNQSINKMTIRRTLQQNHTIIGKNNGTYYEMP